MRACAQVGASGSAKASTASKLATVAVRAIHLPEPVADAIAAHGAVLRHSLSRGCNWLQLGAETGAEIFAEIGGAIEAVEAALRGADAPLGQLRPLGVGAAGAPDNLLLCDPSVCAAAASFAPAIVAGFQLASGAGPLCEEPMSRMGFVIDALDLAPELSVTGAADVAATDANADAGVGAGAGADDAGAVAMAGAAASAALDAGAISGQLIGAVKDACRAALLACPTRLHEPVYACELQAAAPTHPTLPSLGA